MILRTELQKYCSKLHFNLGQTELDYLQHLFLMFLSKTTVTNLIFKGGTALQKAYNLPRFSIDLDFTATDKISSLELIQQLGKEIEAFGYPTQVKEIKTLGETFVLQISGPLKGASSMSIARLKIEISQRETLVLKPVQKEIVPLYSDLKPYSIRVMDAKEIVAEKVRAIMTRNKARDVYDLWFLITSGTKVDKELINKKLTYYNQTFNAKEFEEALQRKEPIWNTDLSSLLPEVPSFKEVVKEIKTTLLKS